jgi:hypothetical protein
VDVNVADGGAAHELAHDVTDAGVDEPDRVAVVIDHGGNQRDLNPNSNPLPSFHIPSSSYSFRVAFPNASDSEEKLAVAWTTTDTYGNNGSTRFSHITRLAGVWDAVLYTSAVTMDIRLYSIFLIKVMVKVGFGLEL